MSDEPSKASVSSSSPTASLPATGPRTAGIRPCPYCGTSVSVDATVCPACGESLPTREKKIRCRRCHKKATANLVICPHCGRELRPAPSRLLTWGVPALIALLFLTLIVTRWNRANPVRWTQDRLSRAVVAIGELGTRLQTDVSITVVPPGEDIADLRFGQAVELATASATSVAAQQWPTEPPPGDEPAAMETAQSEPAAAIVAPSDTPTPVPATATTAPSATPPATSTATSTSVSTLAATGQEATAAQSVASRGTGTATSQASTGTPMPAATSTAVVGLRLDRGTSTATTAVTSSGALLILPTPTPRAEEDVATVTPTPTAIPTPTPQTVIVRAGDTLFEIAQSFDLTVDQLLAANGLSEVDAFTIQPGDELVIPGPEPSGSDGDEATAAAVEYYTVRPGDTFIAIALRLGVTTQALLEANDLTIAEARSLSSGQQLIIPDTEAASGATATVTQTPSPTPTSLPTATPTPESIIRLDAPQLRVPENNTSVSCRGVQELVWAPVPAIAPDDLYIVHLGFLNGAAGENEEVVWVLAQQRPSGTTAWQLDNGLCGLAPQEYGRQWRWYVDVAEQRDGELQTVSLPSPIWSFTWQ